MQSSSRKSRPTSSICNPRPFTQTAFSVTLLIAIVLYAKLSSASEFGISTYRPGIMDLASGLLPPPGHLVVKDLFLFFDSHATILSQDSQPESRAYTDAYTDAIFAAYSSALTIFGANLAFGTIVQLRIASQDLSLSSRGHSLLSRQSTTGGLGDLIVLPAMLGWNFGQFHVSAALGVYAPTGDYSVGRIIDVGLNRWAIEPDVSLTWLDPESGHEVSLFTGYTVNAENSATRYRSGDEFHADFVLAQYLPYGFIAGVAGYAVQQTTPDSGRGAVLGPFKGRVLAIGPLLGKSLAIDRAPLTLTAKYQFEFAAQNRPTGDALWLTAGVMF